MNLRQKSLEFLREVQVLKKKEMLLEEVHLGINLEKGEYYSVNLFKYFNKLITM